MGIRVLMGCLNAKDIWVLYQLNWTNSLCPLLIRGCNLLISVFRSLIRVCRLLIRGCNLLISVFRSLIRVGEVRCRRFSLIMFLFNQCVDISQFLSFWKTILYLISGVESALPHYWPPIRARPCNFERTTPPCAFISVWTYRLSVWHLNLGSVQASVKFNWHTYRHFNQCTLSN